MGSASTADFTMLVSPTLRDAAKFSVSGQLRADGASIAGNMKSDGTRIRIRVLKFSPLRPQDLELGAAASYTLKRGLPSQYPCGTNHGYFLAPGHLQAYVGTEGWAAKVWVDAPAEQETRPGRTHPISAPVDMSGHLAFAEEVARYAVSAYKGSKTVPSENVSFGQATLVGRKSGETQTRYVRLASVASAAGWWLGVGTHGMTSQATRSGRQTMVFVAGANAYKRGAEWVPLPDTTVLVDGELWVPTGVLAGF